MKPERYSNIAINRLLDHNHKVKAFGLRPGVVRGVVIDADLKAYEEIDTVTLYLSPQHQNIYYDYIIGLSPRRVIFNPGTENPEFYDLLSKNGIVYEVACTLVLLATNQY